MSNNEFVDDVGVEAPKKPKGAAKKQSTLMVILNGDFLTRDFMLNNLAYILFLFLLLFLLVAKGYYGKSLVKKVQETRRALDQNTADYIQTKTLFEERTRRYKMVERLKQKALVESENAIQVIKSNAINANHDEQ